MTSPQQHPKRRRLNGRVALVTGTSRQIGIGAAIARRLASDGAALFLTSWSPHDAEMPWGAEPDSTEALVVELRAEGHQVEHLAADLADPDVPAAVVAAVIQAYGALDILVANHARSSTYDLEHLTAAEIDLTYAVNTRATLLLVKEYAARHDDTRAGSVVLFTSGQHKGPMPGELPYAASKGALHQLTASLAAHLLPRGVTVNTVNPGPTDTGWASPEQVAWVREHSLSGRWGTPEDAARLVSWLVSDEARWITGQVIDSEGGFGWGSR
ncbi:SDR family oxidoreductase [Actinopolymorpha alba]|uniref:SDR family oxidoreductase n=1 Tax=Actinopolymorpha alba TaxID=533267 RepID=UPI0006877541|nr:SDR family oxidoreductase [Actinopolymorpha alba]